MALPDDPTQPKIASVDIDGQRYDVHVRISYDGVEYIGRLWFDSNDSMALALPDRGFIPGRSRDEVLEYAQRLAEGELVARFRRAQANKRRYVAFRNVTDEVLRKVRYLNQVAITMRAGLIDLDGAAQEIDLTEHQLHDLIRRLRAVAGEEEPGA
jgi:hypothetical protein